MNLPKIVCSSVIRASQRGDSHGGIYMVDLATDKVDLLLDWDRPDIDWDGRGGDRGVRGMAFYNGRLLAAAGDEVFEFDRDMKVTRSWRSRWLKHTHEVALDKERGLLYVIANIYDAILVLDLNGGYWRGAFILPKVPEEGECARWIDVYQGEPRGTDHLHLDSVVLQGSRLYYGGQHIEALHWVDLKTTEIHTYQRDVPHSHNLQPYADGVIYNIASAHRTVYVRSDGERIDEWETPLYAKSDMEDRHADEKIAVQGYTRGMVLWGDYVIVGSSPATVNVFEPLKKGPTHSVQLSKDVRNSICGIALCEWGE